MSLYQQINLATNSFVGVPVAVPAIFGGWTDSALADVSAAVDPAPQGWAGQGLWPVSVTTPQHDPRRQAVVPAQLSADPSTRTVSGTATLRDLTVDEVAALPPRVADGVTLIKSLTDAQAGAVKQRDLLCIAGRTSVPENLPMVARAAAKVGITPSTWFDLAVSG